MDFKALATQLQELDLSLQDRASSAVNVSLNARNWLIGAHIVEYEQNGSDRAEYGRGLLKELAESLAIKGLSRSSLQSCRSFFLNYPQICQTVSGKFGNILATSTLEICQTLSGELKIGQTATDQSDFASSGAKSSTPSHQSSHASITPPHLVLTRLSFSQIVELLKLDDPLKQAFYEIEAIKGSWSVRELKRQIGSLLFERTGLSTDKEKLLRLVDSTSESLVPRDIIRDPYVFEFLGLRPTEVMEESDLEQALLDHLQNFLLELGRGFCFEERQKRIQIGEDYYFIDLVFYHRILKCHVLIDLKVETFQHGHAGQLNTYVNYFRDREMSDGDNPPIGILLCTAKNASLAQYALGGMDENLFVSQYQLALPEATELQRFLENEARELGIDSKE